MGENKSMVSSVERLDPKFNTWERHTSINEGKKAINKYKRITLK